MLKAMLEKISELPGGEETSALNVQLAAERVAEAEYTRRQGRAPSSGPAALGCDVRAAAVIHDLYELGVLRQDESLAVINASRVRQLLDLFEIWERADVPREERECTCACVGDGECGGQHEQACWRFGSYDPEADVAGWLQSAADR